MKSNIKSFGFFISILLLFVAESIFAIKLGDTMIVFGDSYSDNGNGVFKISDGAFPPSPPYFEGRFSNGPVWVEYLSKKLDIPSVNYAAGGATINSMSVPSASGLNDEIIVPGIRQQINDYVDDAHDKGISAKGNLNLYVVSPFGNDYIYTLRHGPSISSPEQVIGQFITNLQTLFIEVGATNFLVATLPKLENLPGFSRANDTERAILSKIVEDHNVLLKQALDILKTDFRKVKTILVDTDKIFKKFPSKNFEPCLTINHEGTHVCDNPENFLFWDNIHVTTKVHEMLASEAFDLLK
ncbi:GDSL lipase/esterase [Glomus cerebriforme]|uniref:GDSL lipase/esterase n=1 Tax=Glomus cerebriforme TaxID=658196 RepID=A0A397T4R1_9GLOM|nr:GDSL lipase/esterase [Glomus cerebriforme]